jgi:D-alanine-D-alanine ligase
VLAAPLVVKPAEGGSAQGVTFVDDIADLPRALVNAYTYNDVALIERRVTGIEVAVTVLDTGAGPVALPAVEIVPRNGVYSFEARYNAGETSFYTPARLTDAATEKVAAAAITAHEALGLRHLSRVDLIVDPDGVPWFLEANVLPGLTETSLVPLAIEAAGFDLGAVYAGLAERAIRDAATFVE